ncbi:glycosyltransferase [Chryseobacterium sp. GMJ5]|uniref:Glycosyltransferase n=1 Tax=Chryseobacterium gilvum TaxID=2976534 RepID=A0ABT2VZ81_9FLAO|nr:glycosyltransferase [Chryseobacterium gilvum]MCU7614252.1 glycosyltransferase [Chryseobacterium gilvum]
MKTSVALCTYNGEKYISAQLDSILNQTILPDEIVICDDISKDSTVEIIRDYQKIHPNIRVFINESNLGFIKNFEKAILQCSFDIIIISDQDDIWEKDKIEKTIGFFTKNPQFDGVFHDLKLMDKENTQPSYLNWKNISHHTILTEIDAGQLFPSLIIKGSFILGCAVAIRKEAIEKYALKDFPFAHDYFIVQKLSSKNALGFIPESLSSYRLHADQVYGLRYKPEDKNSGLITKTQQYFRDYVWNYLKVLEKYNAINADEDIKSTTFYTTFLKHRNIYLKSLKFAKRKIYIAQCARHHYLDLTWSDLLKY